MSSLPPPTTRSQVRTVRLYGQPHSPESYAIRDFLRRSVVEFEWIELPDNAESALKLGMPPHTQEQWPVVDLPDGTRLFAPTIREIADRLGWVTQPRYTEYDLSIYGAGPAGLSAAVYAASEGLRTVLIERHAVGGQAGTSSLIENYMGFPEGIGGADLAERARQQAVKFGVEVLLMREGIKAEFKNNRIYVNLADGNSMVARANICATGVEYHTLNLPHEERFLNAGLFYGAGASEAPLCINEEVFVVGGGNSAGQAAMYFSRYAKNVTLLVRSDTLAVSLSQYLLARILQTSNIAVLFQSKVTGLDGDGVLRQIEVTNLVTGSIQWLKTQRLFVCIGGAPNTEWARETAIRRDAKGYLLTGTDALKDDQQGTRWQLDRPPYLLETSIPGSFAAGDVRHGSVKRVAAAVGEGAMAVTLVHHYLEETA